MAAPPLYAGVEGALPLLPRWGRRRWRRTCRLAHVAIRLPWWSAPGGFAGFGGLCSTKGGIVGFLKLKAAESGALGGPVLPLPWIWRAPTSSQTHTAPVESVGDAPSGRRNPISETQQVASGWQRRLEISTVVCTGRGDFLAAHMRPLSSPPRRRLAPCGGRRRERRLPEQGQDGLV